MREVLKKQGKIKHELPVTVKDAEFGKHYFMRYNKGVFHLERERRGEAWNIYWSSSQGTCLGGPCKSLEDALDYALDLGAKVYQFNDWDEVLPDL